MHPKRMTIPTQTVKKGTKQTSCGGNSPAGRFRLSFLWEIGKGLAARFTAFEMLPPGQGERFRLCQNFLKPFARKALFANSPDGKERKDSLAAQVSPNRCTRCRFRNSNRRGFIQTHGFFDSLKWPVGKIPHRPFPLEALFKSRCILSAAFQYPFRPPCPSKP